MGPKSSNQLEIADVKQVLGQLPGASTNEDLVATRVPEFERTDVGRKSEHSSNVSPCEDLKNRSIPELDQEREAFVKRRKQLKKERKRERKKEMQYQKELQTLEERVAELRKQREELEVEIEQSYQRLGRQKSLQVKQMTALRPKLGEAHEQAARDEVRNEQAEETMLRLGGEVEGPGTKLALEAGLGLSRGPVTHSVGPNARHNSVLDTCKKGRSPPNVEFTKIDNIQITSNKLKESIPHTMADQNDRSSLPLKGAALTEHVAADFTTGDKHDISATESSTSNGEETPSHSTSDIVFEPGNLHSSPKAQQASAVAEGTQNIDAGDNTVISPAAVARLPKQLRRLQSVLNRLERNEQERYIDTVLEDYEALSKQHEEFFSGDFNAPRFIEALGQTQTELGPFLCRMSQGYAYLHLWQRGFDLQCSRLAILFRDGAENIETAAKKTTRGVEDIGSTWRPSGRRGQWDFSSDHIFSDLNPGRHVVFRLLHSLWNAVESTEAWLKTIKPLHLDARWKEDPRERSRPKDRSHYPKLGRALDYLKVFQDLSRQFADISKRW